MEPRGIDSLTDTLSGPSASRRSERTVEASPPPAIPHDTRPSYLKIVEEKVSGSKRLFAVAAAVCGWE